MGRAAKRGRDAGIRLIKRSTIYQEWAIRLIREVVEHDGQRMVRHTIQHPGAVVVVPVLDRSPANVSTRGKGPYVVCVRQYRRAIGRELLELPAGTLETPERPIACARRELQEETGWKAGRMRQISRFYTAPGVLSEELTIFLARNLTPGTARPDPDEMVTPVILPLKTALARIHTGTIRDAKTIIGLLLAQRLLRYDGR